MTRKTLKVYGSHGRSARAFVQTMRSGTRLVRVMYRELGRQKVVSWHDTPENRAIAKAYAEGVADRLKLKVADPPKAIMISALFDRYLLGNAEHWREATRVNAVNRWRKFQHFAGPSLAAHLVTPELIDDFRAAMRKPGMAKGRNAIAATQIAEIVKVVKAAFRFGRQRKLLAENPLADYTVRLAKDERRLDMPEYSGDEWASILGELTPRTALGWRPYCAVVLAGVLGPRINALLHLTWGDVDLHARSVTWQAKWDKLGLERVQPLPRAAVRALRLARVWRQRAGYTGPWVFFGAQDRTRERRPWTYQALNAALHAAEDRAGVPRRQYVAMHAFRRMAAGNMLALSGSIKEGLDWIGDSDLRVGARYLKKREVRQRELAGHVTAPKGYQRALRPADDLMSKTEPAPTEADAEGVTP